jgi:histone-lysine N-methyltransferase SETMAR
MYQELISIKDFQHNMGAVLYHGTEWKHPGSPMKYKFKSQPSAGKVMLTLFWDSQGLILDHYLKRGTRVNSVLYSEMLSTKLKPVILNKCRGLLSTGVLLLQNNAHPHTTIHTVQILVKLGFDVLDHPAYSPDLRKIMMGWCGLD